MKYVTQSFLLNHEEHELGQKIINTLDEGLEYIANYEKLSFKEGQISLIFNKNERGIEIHAPHLIPNALSQIWTAPTMLEAFTSCLKDLTTWIDLEKDAPRDKFWIDIS